MSVIPIRPSSAVTVLLIRSRSTSLFSSQGSSGAAKEETMFTGVPAVEPGGVDLELCRICEQLNLLRSHSPIRETFAPFVGGLLCQLGYRLTLLPGKFRINPWLKIGREK